MGCKICSYGTISVYGCPENGIINENSDRKYGYGDYADSKLDGEKLVVILPNKMISRQM